MTSTSPINICCIKNSVISGPLEFRDSVTAEKIADFSVLRGIHCFPWNL